MTITGDLDLLTKHQTTESNHVLSIYLNVKPQTGIFKRHSEVELLTRFRSIQEQLSNETERRSFRASARRVRQFMARHRPAGLGMVLFCGDQDGFFWWRDLKVPVRTEVHWTHSPHIRPLLELQDEFERYCVILTDREQGQLFTVFMGEIEQHLEVASSTEIKRSKKPGSGSHSFPNAVPTQSGSARPLASQKSCQACGAPDVSPSLRSAHSGWAARDNRCASSTAAEAPENSKWWARSRLPFIRLRKRYSQPH